MAAQVSIPPQRIIRVYCPTHKVGFSTAATSNIECSSSAHVLARDFPNESFWEYCCDCQHYWPIDAAKGNKGSADCPVCERHIDRRALCSECKVMSVESNDGGKRKAFSFSANGFVKPACPGCLSQSNRPVLEHSCPDFGFPFFTPREVCPFCDDRLEPPPSFPCSVATYVEKLPRSAISVSFEPEQSLLKKTKTGEYYLIPIGTDASISIVIPSAAKLGSKQDYYNSHYELFNCENPVAGEIVILSPAVAEAVEGGWQLKEAGFIEIKSDPLPVQPPVETQTTTTCTRCSTVNVAQHSFCKRCGLRLTPVSLADGDPSANVLPEDEQFANASTASAVQSHNEALPVATSIGPQTKAILLVVTGIAVLGIIISIVAVVSNRSPSIEDKLDKAIAAGQIFSPATDNAHDLYFQLKNSAASEEKLRKYRDKLLPLLTERKFQLIKDFMIPGSDDLPLDEWQAAYQSLQFALELKPGDTSLRARALYCEGRLAYLVKDEDRAIQVWTRAAEADKSWPLPVNGIGLIYTARKNYSAARSYYSEAVRRDASWAYPYNNLGTSFYFEKNYYDAKTHYRKAAELAPQWARPHSWLGDIALKEQDYNTAVQEFSLVLEPNATGTKNMDLEKIRQKLGFAQQRVGF